MGSLFSKKERKQEQRHQPPPQPKVQVNEQEMALAKVKIYEDKLNARVKKCQRDEEKIEAKIKACIKANKKEEAYFHLKQIKLIKDTRKSTTQRLQFVQKQISTIEETMDDVKFTQVLKDSNKVVEQLTKEIDLEEVKLAKQLQEEGAMRREELNALLDDNDEDDQEIQKQIQEIEAQTLKEQFDRNPTGEVIKGREDRKEIPVQTVKQEQRQAMLN